MLLVFFYLKVSLFCFHSSGICLLDTEFWVNISSPPPQDFKDVPVFLSSMVSDEKLSINQIIVLLLVICHFSLAAFKVCSLSLPYNGLLCTVAGFLCVYPTLIHVFCICEFLSSILGNFYPLFLQIFFLSPLHLVFYLHLFMTV